MSPSLWGSWLLLWTSVLFPLAHEYEGAPHQLETTSVLEPFVPHLNYTKKVVNGQHLKYDLNVLARYGVTINAPIHDTMLMSYALNSVATRHNMDDLALHYLGYKTTKFEDIAGKGVKQKTFNQIELSEAAHYAAEDADITLRLFEALFRLESEPSLMNVYETIERPLARILSRIERGGVKLDVEQLLDQSQKLERHSTS